MSQPGELSSWLDTGYRNLRAQLGGWVGMAAVVLGASLAFAGIQELLGFAAEQAGEASSAASALLHVGSGLVGVAFLVVQTWMQLGAWRIALEQEAGRPVDVARLLSVEPRQLGSALLFLLLVYVGIGAGAVLVAGALLLSVEAAVALGLTLLVTVLIVYARLQFVYGLIVLGLGALEAVERSWMLTRGRTGVALGFLLLTGLFAGMGVLACFVGLVITAPFQWTAGAAALRDLVRRTAPEPSPAVT